MANLEGFVRRRSPGWVELDMLVLQAGDLRDRPRAKQVRRMYLLYRSAAADLAYARREFPGERDVIRLDDLVRRASQRIYAPLPRKRYSLLNWFTTGMWQRVAERPLMLLVCFLAFLVPFIATAFWANAEPAAAQSVVPLPLQGVVDRDTAQLETSAQEKVGSAVFILTNNIRVALIVFAAGLLVGIGSVAACTVNGLWFGGAIGLTIQYGNGSHLLQFVVPHGFLEFSCIIVAGAAGLRIGWSFIDPGYKPRAQAIASEGLAAVQMMLVVVLGLVVAGIVEGIVSTSGIPTALGLTIGVTLLVLFWGMIFWRGRSKLVVEVD